MPDGRPIGAAGEQRDAVRRLLRLHADDLAVEMPLEGAQVRSVVARTFEIEADRKRRAARTLRPPRREREEHRRVDSAAGHDRDAPNADERRVYGILERASKCSRSVAQLGATTAELTRRTGYVIDVDAGVRRSSEPLGRCTYHPRRKRGGIYRRRTIEQGRERNRGLWPSPIDE